MVWTMGDSDGEDAVDTPGLPVEVSYSNSILMAVSHCA